MKILSQKAWRTCTLGAAIVVGAAGASYAQTKSLTIGLTADPSHLYPLAGEELSSNIMYYHLYDPLVSRSADLEFGPGLAESWEQVDDTTWRFKLREGVTFHNGNAFTAADVVFTVEKARASIRPDLVASIASATAIDDLTVEIDESDHNKGANKDKGGGIFKRQVVFPEKQQGEQGRYQLNQRIFDGYPFAAVPTAAP